MNVPVDVDTTTPASLQHQRSKENLRLDESHASATVEHRPMYAPEGAKSSVETCDEIKTICFSWQMSNLKSIFESSKGDSKSKCLKSQPWGDGRWELYMYANSGTDYVSLYLSAIPTVEERDRGAQLAARRSAARALIKPHQSRRRTCHSRESSSFEQRGQAVLHSNSAGNAAGHASNGEPTWVRDGSFRFAFEIRIPGSRNAIKSMEAADHVFSSEARNWGWQSFAKRSDVYYGNAAAKISDALTVVCTITYAASLPTLAPWNEAEQRLLPNDLFRAFASTFNNPTCSDVRFVFRNRRRQHPDRYLYAMKSVLAARAEYYKMMFCSGFVEGVTQRSGSMHQYDDEESSSGDSDVAEASLAESTQTSTVCDDSGDDDVFTSTEPTMHISTEDTDIRDNIADEIDVGILESGKSMPEDDSISDGRNLGGLSTMRSVSTSLPAAMTSRTTLQAGSGSSSSAAASGRQYTDILIRDISYSTYKALLHYLYTDQLCFAPLSSIYTYNRDTAALQGVPFSYHSKRRFVAELACSTLSKEEREEEIPRCSAKAMYRLADRLDFPQLRARAFEHIIGGMIPEIIPYEIFGAFSDQFKEIRAVQLEMLLTHWNEIRNGQAMRNVLRLVRRNEARWPGFEEVWEQIITKLDHVNGQSRVSAEM